MDWIMSGGGPLICLEAALAPAWQGVDGSGEKDLPPGITDYDRACRMTGYAGLLPVGNGSGLVLGDMPLQTFVWEHQEGIIIVRFRYAEPETKLSDIMPRLDRRCFDHPLEMLSLACASSRFLLFDSAYGGSDSDREALSFAMVPGSYRVATCEISPDKQTSLLLHRFERLG